MGETLKNPCYNTVYLDSTVLIYEWVQFQTGLWRRIIDS